MRGTLGSSLYSTPGMAEAFGALNDTLIGGRREGERFRNVAYAENARANIEKTGEETLALQQQARSRRALGDALAQLTANGRQPTPAEFAALSQHMPFIPGADAPSMRVGFGLGSAGMTPGNNATVVGSVGGDAGNTRYGVDERNRTSIAQSGISAGATVAAAREAQRGALERLRLTPPNPGADGAYMTPAQRTFYGIPAPEGAPGSTGLTFIPGAVTVAPGATRLSPAPGPAPLGSTLPPTMEPYTAPNRPGSTPASVSAGIGADIARGVMDGNPDAQQQLVRLAQAAGVTPEVMLRSLLNPQAGTQEVRNAGAVNLANTRAGQEMAQLERRIAGQLELANLTGDQRAALTALQGEITAGRVASQDEAAMARVAASIAGRLEGITRQQAGAGERNAATIAGAGERNAATIAGAGQRTAAQTAAQTEIARLRSANARPLSGTTQQMLSDALAAAAPNMDRVAQGNILETAARMLSEGQQQNPQNAINEALRLSVEAGEIERAATGFWQWLGLAAPSSYAPTAPAAPVPARQPAGGPRGGGAPAPSRQPTAPRDQGVQPAPRDPAQREVNRVYTNPNGVAARWTGTGWEVVQ